MDNIQKQNVLPFSLMQGQDYGVNFVSLMSVVRAAYAITDCNLCKDSTGNDEQITSNEWDAAFGTSFFYNRESADLEESSFESNWEFWIWYLIDCISFVCNNEKHPECCADNRVDISTPVNYNVTLSDEVNRLNSALSSHIHVLTNRKKMLRMRPYTTDGELVIIVVDSLQGYPCVLSTVQELENYCMIGLFNYDIVRFLYCVALLALPSDFRALDYLVKLACTLGQGQGVIFYPDDFE